MSLEHIIRFTTDGVGLERTLRFWQALLLLTTSSPVLLECVVAVLGPALGTTADPAKHDLALAQYKHVLVGLRNQVNIVRRYFRLFRFVESFYVAHQLFSKLMMQPSASADAEDKEAKETKEDQEKEDQEKGKPKSPKKVKSVLPLWLDAFSRAFLGMHLFLEVLALPETLKVDGLAVWGSETTGLLIVESQRFWFLSLACSLAAGLLRLVRVARDVPLPELQMDKPGNENKHKHEQEHEHEQPLAVDSDMSKDPTALSGDISREQARLRRISRAHLNQRRAWRRLLRARAALLARHALADGLDLVLPGSVLGWLPVRPTTVGAVMLTTSVLTGWDSWVRCGKEIQKSS